MAKLDELKKRILEDGVIDVEEVEILKKELYADGQIDRQEADFLFDLNDATSGEQNHASWQQFFVEAISSHLLNDEKSPGQIDKAEADWLVARVEGDGTYDDNEKALLQNLKAKATSMPANLKAKLP